MKLIDKKNTGSRQRFFVQAILIGSGMFFCLSGIGEASAQTMADTALTQAATGIVAAKVVQDVVQPSAAAMEGQAAAQPVATDAAQPAFPTAPATMQPVMPTTQPQPVAVTAPPQTPAGGASPATPAELAIVQNAAVLNTLDADKKKKAAYSVADIPAVAADVRPLPERYLVVRKDHAADDTDARLVAARMALSRGQNQAALELFNDLYQENPLDERISMGRAVAFQKLGQTDEALLAYEAALGRNPKNVEALTNMLGLLQGQDPDTAIEKLLQMRSLYPANADVTAQLGTIYGVAGDYENALRYLDMADALKPGNPNILYNKAVVYDRMGKATQAVDLYRQIVLMAADRTLGQSFPVEMVKKRLAVIR